jgi:uncharacterized protein (DUF952 family)
VEVELLNQQKNGQFTDEPVQIKDGQIHHVNSPDVLGISSNHGYHQLICCLLLIDKTRAKDKTYI